MKRDISLSTNSHNSATWWSTVRYNDVTDLLYIHSDCTLSHASMELSTIWIFKALKLLRTTSYRRRLKNWLKHFRVGSFEFHDCAFIAFSLLLLPSLCYLSKWMMSERGICSLLSIQFCMQSLPLVLLITVTFNDPSTELNFTSMQKKECWVKRLFLTKQFDFEINY